jgi:hypothetical protein
VASALHPAIGASRTPASAAGCFTARACFATPISTQHGATAPILPPSS